MPDNRSDHRPMAAISVSTQGVEKLMSNLNPTKAAGPDGIPPRVLRELAREVAPILTKIYRSSPQTGEAKRDWSDTLVTPRFKKGEHYNPANCRPGSLTSIPCELLEQMSLSQKAAHRSGTCVVKIKHHTCLLQVSHIKVLCLRITFSLTIFLWGVQQKNSQPIRPGQSSHQTQGLQQ